ncbi:glycoside hydrolase family 25 protein [Sphingopyxis yananensis]|uniref:glycoside hydrolase family 25 protein n=1 Tax=Sphingopyxis yananensis TaxID=2886687 RepID=UPI001D0F7918|nr:GH25 family lysozyme [Sphingopyxis yananensis]MCC2603194.1 glycoside hydrolase [Sphingopyxis yananensis]
MSRLPASGRNSRSVSASTAMPAMAAMPERLRRMAVRAGSVLLVALLALALILWWAARWTPDRQQYPVQGINVDASNGDIHWGWMKAAGADFAYVMATDGSERTDARFKANMAGAREAGVRVGAMHRYNVCQLAADQAANFIRHVPRRFDSLPAVVWLDFDDRCSERPSRALLLSELATFLAQIEAHSGKRSLIAPGPAFDKEYDVSNGIARTIWLRRDFFEPSYGAHAWTMWQANRHVRLAGASGTVGWNVVRPEGETM